MISDYWESALSLDIMSHLRKSLFAQESNIQR
jgi:hypothetical protein